MFYIINHRRNTKITMGYYFTPTKMVSNPKTENKFWQNVGFESSTCIDGDVNGAATLKWLEALLKMLSTPELQYHINSAPRDTPRKMKTYVHTKLVHK